MLGGWEAYEGHQSARAILLPVTLLALPLLPVGTLAGAGSVHDGLPRW